MSPLERKTAIEAGLAAIAGLLEDLAPIAARSLPADVGTAAETLQTLRQAGEQIAAGAQKALALLDEVTGGGD